MLAGLFFAAFQLRLRHGVIKLQIACPQAHMFQYASCAKTYARYFQSQAPPCSSSLLMYKQARHKLQADKTR